ncbi:hypothetical protein SAMN02745823_00657 [Sporobacter termitidis DSM 10068]|uniref:Uncharacterized protein n=1 Tax=Sporobacter termitidis DSM 10068 TaxID=1123282 RepID=A0A1M5USI1_9FIRM|nr:hypothetical protein [Sporobacter termitidis]SHH65886.1 hypothetical protein SAMN02745823_00657 [Sporobacter termitidis DSM 10068]
MKTKMSGIGYGFLALLVLALLTGMCFIVYHNSSYAATASYVVPSLIDAALILFLLCVSFYGKIKTPAEGKQNPVTYREARDEDQASDL